MILKNQLGSFLVDMTDLRHDELNDEFEINNTIVLFMHHLVSSTIHGFMSSV